MLDKTAETADKSSYFWLYIGGGKASPKLLAFATYVSGERFRGWLGAGQQSIQILCLWTRKNMKDFIGTIDIKVFKLNDPKMTLCGICSAVALTKVARGCIFSCV